MSHQCPSNRCAGQFWFLQGVGVVCTVQVLDMLAKERLKGPAYVEGPNSSPGAFSYGHLALMAERLRNFGGCAD